MQNDHKGVVKYNEPLAHYTTWRVGGAADRLYLPTDLNDLTAFLVNVNRTEPMTWLGLGSNVLIRAGGIRGTVIVTQGLLNGLQLLTPTTIRVEAGVSCAKMARFVSKQNLSGAEFWAGIPGTMGGALRMNAGCHGGETWDYLKKVETITRDGVIHHRLASEFKVTYRQVEGLDAEEWFVAGIFEFPPGEKESSLATIKSLLERRTLTQPTSEYNCGSVFRNPIGGYAAVLIEQCGLKGYEIGYAKVSEKHANFIINKDGLALPQDIEDLIGHVQETVLRQQCVELKREVHFLGERA